MNGLHCVGVTGSYEGDEEVAVLGSGNLVDAQVSNNFRFSSYFAREYYCKVVRRLNSQLSVQ